MLLRVDTYPHTSPPTATGVTQAPPPSSRPPVHACLSTSSHHNDKPPGTLLTVGRKNCDVTFESDKSVSRSHCSFRLVSLDPNAHSGGASAPLNEEERQACESSLDGNCLVLSDLGSKFGTYVVTDRPKKDGETGDEMDDDVGDGVGTPQMSQAASALSKSPSNKKQVTTRLEPNSSVVLTTLSTTNTAIVQVGQSGSTILLTRIPLTFCLSRISTEVRSQLQTSAPRIGATVSTTWHFASTHLVTPDKMSTAKTIAAWCARKPTVTADFVEALLRRSRMSDPLPRERDFVPPGKVPMDDIPDGEPRDVLRHYKVISLLEDDMHSLVRAAGATMVNAFELDDDTFFDGTWLNGLENDGKVVTFVDSGSRKVKKRREILVRWNIRCVNQKEVAGAVTERRYLKDVDGLELVPSRRDETGTAAAAAAPAQQAPEETKSQEERQEGIGTEGSAAKPEEIESNPRPTPDDNVSSTPMGGAPVTPTSAAWFNRKKTDHVDNPPRRRPVSSTKKPLPKTDDGWFVAAPRNRDEYIPNSTELAEMGVNLNEVAPSETRSNLIIRTEKQIAERHAQQLARSNQFLQQNNPNLEGVPDFKRFKKNSVIAGSYVHKMSRIKLRSVLPKETERQRQLEMTQRELEREQRIADALFQDPVAGMRDYLPPTQKKSSGAGRGRKRKAEV